MQPINRVELMLERISALEKLDDIHAVLEGLKSAYQLKSYTYYVFRLPENGKPFLATTSPEAWIEHYFASDYFPVDPIMQQMRHSMVPVDWRDVEKTNAFVIRYFQEASDHGLAKNGITIPIRAVSGEMALMSISSGIDDQEWLAVRHRLMADFHLFANAIHARMISISKASPKTSARSLSNRELQCLTWAANGKTNDEIAIILSISERVVRGYIESARGKLNATNRVQAVVKAISYGFIRPEAA